MAKHLRFTYGPMASSKTLRLLALAHDLEEKGIQIMVLKPSTDNRDGEGIIRSRAGLQRECAIFDSDVDLYKAIKAYKNVLSSQFETLRWVLIDEAQFLTERQVEQLSDAVDFLDVEVSCYGLRTDFRSVMFPGSKRLFELADDIEEVKSTCICGERKASVNARVDESGMIVTNGEQVLVGGDDRYAPICRKCWKDLTRPLQSDTGEMETDARRDA